MRNVTPLVGVRTALFSPSPAFFLDRVAVVMPFSPYSGTVLSLSQWKHSINLEHRETDILVPAPNHSGRWWRKDQVLGSNSWGASSAAYFWGSFLLIQPHLSGLGNFREIKSLYGALLKLNLLAIPPSEKCLWMTKHFILSGVLCPYPSLPLLPDN